MEINKKFHLGGQAGHNSNTPGHLQEHGRCCHTMCGDWDSDGNVNVADIVAVIAIILGD